MNVRILVVPYDSGVRGVLQGRGPEHLLECGLVSTVTRCGHSVVVEIIEIAAPSHPVEVGSMFQINRVLAERVQAAISAGALPVVLAGNCATALGTVAGLGSREIGVIWLDSHADLNTPETTTSGFFDGMALAMVMGRCWGTLAASVPGFSPVPERQVVLAGARDLDPAERALLATSATAVVPARALRADSVELRAALATLAVRVSGAYLHLDLDVLNPMEVRANRFAAPGGPTTTELAAVLRLIGKQMHIAAVAVTAYDPSFDPQDKAVHAVETLLEAALEVPGGRSPRHTGHGT
jgi:arginase